MGFAECIDYHSCDKNNTFVHLWSYITEIQKPPITVFPLNTKIMLNIILKDVEQIPKVICSLILLCPQLPVCQREHVSGA